MSNNATAATLIPDLSALLSDVPAQAILSRTFVRTPDMRGVLFRFAAGEQLSEHTSSHPAILHFLAGTADITLGDESSTVNAGAWAYMPANLPHSIHAVTPVDMLLLMLG